MMDSNTTPELDALVNDTMMKIWCRKCRGLLGVYTIQPDREHDLQKATELRNRLNATCPHCGRKLPLPTPETLKLHWVTDRVLRALHLRRLPE